MKKIEFTKDFANYKANQILECQVDEHAKAMVEKGVAKYSKAKGAPDVDEK